MVRHWERAIPSSDEVVVSNGVAGRFADRRYIYVLLYDSSSIPLYGRPVYFVLARSVGIEPPQTLTAATAAAARVHPGARVLADRDGIEVIYWDPPPGRHRLHALP